MAGASGHLGSANNRHAVELRAMGSKGQFHLDLRDNVLRALVARLAPTGRLILNSHRNPRALYALLDRLTGGDAGGMDLHLSKLRGLLRRHGLKVDELLPIGAWMYRARMLGAIDPAHPAAAARERRFSHPLLAPIAPDVIVVASLA